MKPLLNLKSYDVVRTTSPDPVLGRVIDGTETIVPIKANVQPAGGAMKTLPEARRSENVIRIFTATELFLVGRVVDTVTYNADQIVYNGERYEVFRADGWPGHFECFASRQVTP